MASQNGNESQESFWEEAIEDESNVNDKVSMTLFIIKNMCLRNIDTF